MIGEQFGKWTVTALGEVDKRHKYWVCQCECGVVRSVRQSRLRAGESKSCGCGRPAPPRNKPVTREQMGLPPKYIARLHRNIVLRCYDDTHRDYEAYGKRGIRVCDAWLISASAIYSDMGDRPPGHSLDRIDVDGDYGPENCRWATAVEQANNKRNNVILTALGRSQSVAAWSRELDIRSHVLRERIKSGWSHERIVTTPVRKQSVSQSLADGECRERSAEYIAWIGMRNRCNNKNNPRYPQYGHRGIKVCDEWRSFEQFVADVGHRPTTRHSLDRIDVNGDYCPANVRWADNLTQSNNRTNNIRITVAGATRTVAEWARQTGLTARQIQGRISSGRNPESFLTEAQV